MLSPWVCSKAMRLNASITDYRLAAMASKFVDPSTIPNHSYLEDPGSRTVTGSLPVPTDYVWLRRGPEIQWVWHSHVLTYLY
jgi:hypothetical protein